MPAFIKTRHDEQLWRKAKSIAARAGKHGNWAYVTGVFKRMKGGHIKRAGFNPYRSYMEKAASNPLLGSRTPFNHMVGSALEATTKAVAAAPGHMYDRVRSFVTGAPTKAEAAAAAAKLPRQTMAGPLPKQTVKMTAPAHEAPAPAAAPAPAHEGFGLSDSLKKRLAVGAGVGLTALGGAKAYQLMTDTSWRDRPNPYLYGADYRSDD